MTGSTLVETRLSGPSSDNMLLYRVQESCVFTRDRRAHSVRRASTDERDGPHRHSTYLNPISASASVLREGGQYRGRASMNTGDEIRHLDLMPMTTPAERSAEPRTGTLRPAVTPGEMDLHRRPP